MRPHLPLLALLAAAGLVHAEPVTVPFHNGVSLRTAGVTAMETAELQVLPHSLLAENGIRPADGDHFSTSASLVMGERYIVRGIHDVEYTVEVKNLSSKGAVLEVAARLPPPGADGAMKARYHLVSYRLGDGEPSQPAYPDLRLYVDGTFRMGGAHGFWMVKEGRLALDGYYAQWGVAEMTDDRVIFKFPRAGSYVEATLERVPADGAQASR